MDDYEGRIDDLATRAARVRQDYDLPADPPDEERAMEVLREGLGPTIWVYVEARTGDREVRFERATFDRLERALNDWLEVYAACHGVEFDANFTVREAAEALVETRNVRDTARVLTHVPEGDNGHKR